MGHEISATVDGQRLEPHLLSISMRDFGVGAGIAAAAFGPEAAAPLGLYGIMVIIWGTGVASRARRTA